MAHRPIHGPVPIGPLCSRPASGIPTQGCGVLCCADTRMPRHKKKNKRNSKKSSSKASSSTAIPQQMMMMMPMAQPHAAQAQASSTSSLSSESADSQELRDSKLLHTGARFLVKLPRIRLQQLVEAVHPQFDTAYTAALSVEDLARILWMTTGPKPNTPCRNMRVKT